MYTIITLNGFESKNQSSVVFLTCWFQLTLFSYIRSIIGHHFKISLYLLIAVVEIFRLVVVTSFLLTEYTWHQYSAITRTVQYHTVTLKPRLFYTISLSMSFLVFLFIVLFIVSSWYMVGVPKKLNYFTGSRSLGLFLADITRRNVWCIRSPLWT